MAEYIEQKNSQITNIIEYCASEMKVHMQWRGTKTSWMLCDKVYFKKRDKQDSSDKNENA